MKPPTPDTARGPAEASPLVSRREFLHTTCGCIAALSGVAGLGTPLGSATTWGPRDLFSYRFVVIGLGGGGTEAVHRLVPAELPWTECVALDTDVRALERTDAHRKLLLAAETSRGLGCGHRPEIGERAARESRENIRALVEHAHMVLVLAGLGGGTGTGAAPVVARLARDAGALTIGVVTLPFRFEGRRRRREAREGLPELARATDSTIVIPNDRTIDILDPHTRYRDALRFLAELLTAVPRTFIDFATLPGRVNVGLADIRGAFENAGIGAIGIGSARGSGRARDAALAALRCPLVRGIDRRIVKGAAIQVAGREPSLGEIEEVGHVAHEAFGDDVLMFLGDKPGLETDDTLRVTVIAAGGTPSVVRSPPHRSRLPPFIEVRRQPIFPEG